MKQLVKTVLSEGNVNLEIPETAVISDVLFASPECVIFIMDVKTPAPETTLSEATEESVGA